NTYPPLPVRIDLPLRKIGKTGRLDPAEQQVLATLLQVNRSDRWKFGDAAGGDVNDTQRKILASTLQESQGAVWDAFVGSLCLRAEPLYPNMTWPRDKRGQAALTGDYWRAFVLETDLQAL